MNSRIAQYEMKLKQTEQYVRQQELEHSTLLQKVHLQKNRYADAALLLSEFIESCVEEDKQLLHKQNDIYLDIDEM